MKRGITLSLSTILATLMVALLLVVPPVLAQSPPAATNLSASPYSNTVVYLNWDRVSQSDTFNLYRSTSPGGEGAVPVQTQITYDPHSDSGQEYYDTVPSGNTTYYYQVTEVSQAGEGPKSNEVSATPGTNRRTGPTIAASPGVGQITLTWPLDPSATSYNLYRYTVGSNSTATDLYKLGLVSMTYTDTNVTSGTKYLYYVTSVNKDGNSGHNNSVLATPLPASSYLYVTYLGGTTVDVVDPATFKIVKTISGINASNGTYGIAESVDGTKVYTGRGTLYALDSLTGDVLASVPAPVYGLSLAVSPDGKRVYGANGYGGYAVYDATSLSVLHSLASTSGDINIGQTLVAISPDNTLFAVCNFYYGGGVSIYRTGDYALVANAAVQNPLGCVFSKDSRSLFVTENGNSSVAVISTGTGAVTKVLPVGGNPEDIAISTDGSKVFVVNDTSNFLSVINTATLTVTNTSATGYGGDSIAYSVDGQHLYTAVNGLLLEIDPITLQITRQLAVNGTVEGLTTAVPH